MKPITKIPTALLSLCLIFGLSACFHDEASDDHHDETITIDIHDEEVVDATNRKEGVTGTASLLLHEAEVEVTGSVTFTGGEPDLLHIHAGFAGQTGPVVVTLNDDAVAGTWIIPEASESLTAEQMEMFEAGGYYLNAHFTDGTTIRGQIVVHDVTFVVTDLTDANSVGSTGAGFAAITVNKEAAPYDITAFVTVTGLAAENAVTSVHIHYDNADDAATPPTFPKISLTDTATADKTIFSTVDSSTDNDSISATDLVEAEHGRWYINVHTPTNGTPAELKGVFGELPGHDDTH